MRVVVVVGGWLTVVFILEIQGRISADKGHGRMISKRGQQDNNIITVSSPFSSLKQHGHHGHDPNSLGVNGGGGGASFIVTGGYQVTADLDDKHQDVPHHENNVPTFRQGN